MVIPQRSAFTGEKIFAQLSPYRHHGNLRVPSSTRMAISRKPKKASNSTALALSSPEQPELLTSEFRKANDAIGFRVVEGKFSLLSRRIYNAFIFRAQEVGKTGVDAPADVPGFEEYYWIRMADLCANTEYTSRDYEFFKEHAEALQNIKVEATSDKMWASERLLAGLTIFNTSGLRNKGGTVFIGFAFPPQVKEKVLKPDTYTKLSLYYQAVLRSAHSLALYEVCRRYATSPSHLTNRDSWQEWYHVLSGNSIKDVVLPEYKYFKRDMIVKALSEINSVTDIDVELIETKRGRKVEEIQFRVQLKAQASLLEPGAAIVIDSSVIERMLRLGVSEADAKEYYSNYEEKLLLATIDFVEKRIKKGPNVDAPAGYFRTALQKGFATVAPVAQPLSKNKTASKPRKGYRERFIAARNQEALRYYGELSAQEQTGLFNEFSAQVDRSIKPHLKKGLNSPVLSAAFADWLATRTWGEVTDAAVLDFAELDG
jgi:plasmid replication initiation protein